MFRQRNQHRSRAAASTLEAVVALTLLGAVLGAATPLLVRHDRLLTGHRDYQLALEELSNHCDRLAALPPADLPSALEQLAPSPWAAAKLPEAKLKGELTSADIGQRLTLRLSWNGGQSNPQSVRLATWVFPDLQRPAAAVQEARP